MKNSIIILALIFNALLSSCGSSESPFYNSKEDMLKQVEKIEKQFPGNLPYKNISLVYDPTVGNILSLAVKQKPESKMVENWSYVNTPLSGGRRGMRFKFGAFGSWSKANEQFETENDLRYFTLKQIPWDEVPAWISKAAADMQKKGVAEPEMELVSFLNNGRGLVALISLQTQGGGSSLHYEFNMDGKLATEPY